MHNPLRCILAGLVFVSVTSCTNASARSGISRLSEIAVKPGSTQIAMFVEDGRSALITEGWRDLGQGAGYPIYTVMIPSANLRRGWDIVPIESGDHQTSYIAGSVRFARGWLDGKPATFIFTARRDPDANADFTKPAPILIDAYRLATSRANDKSENAFVPITTIRASGKFCNPDAAIAHEFDLDGPTDSCV